MAEKLLGFTRVSLAELKPDPQNARVHPRASIDSLKASLKEFGQPEALVVQTSSGIVISGNGRLQAMQELGLEAADVRYVDWPAERCRAYSLVANQTALLADWDSDMVERQLRDLGRDQFAMAEMGFDGFLIDDTALEHDTYGDPEPAGAADAVERTDRPDTIDPPEEAGAADSAPSHVKLVQLFFDEQSQQRFYELTDRAAAHYGTTSLTDTVMATLLENDQRRTAAA